MKVFKFLCLFVLLVCIFFSIYFIKCQLDIDLIKDFSFHKIPPFNLLQNRNPYNIVYADEINDNLFSNKFDLINVEDNWDNLWMREEGRVSLGHDPKGHDNSLSLLITSKSDKDWSLQHKKMIEVEPGEVYSFSGWVKTYGDKAVGILSVVLYDTNRQVKQWNYAVGSVSKSDNWQEVKQEFIVPLGIKYIRFRLTGIGEGKTWFDEIKFMKEEKTVLFDQVIWSIENSYLKFTIDASKGRWIAEDKRSSKKWETSLATTDFLVKNVIKGPLKLQLEIVNPQTMDSFITVISLVPKAPEIIFSIDKDPNTKLAKLEFPSTFGITKNDKIVLPLSEGFLFNYQTAFNIIPSSLQYKGGWPLAFWGATNDNNGWMEIIETPIDFELVKDTSEGTLSLKNRWLAQKGSFGYKRQVRYIFFDKGGYIAMAKRYRQYAISKGLMKTLEDKNHERKDNIGKIIGAVDVWVWDKDNSVFIRELKQLGIKKAMISNLSDPLDIRLANSDGYITSRYDIYQDAWPPADYNITYRDEGWPEDLVLDEKGDWIKGWVVKRGSKEYPGGVISSIRGLERAKKEIPKDLINNPYTARFIDTTTASPWREDYDLRHPTTRSEDLRYKMALLGFCSKELGLVTGSEDGVDAAVPFTDYFEGMMSPAFARLPESGQNVAAVKYILPTENFLKYQVGEQYRIPLWDLIFHDAVVTTWYWDDSNNRIPELWWRRDLFNILYGNMPLWAIRNWDYWKQYRDRFIESYKNVGPVFEKVGWAEMLTHRFVTEDHTVQETTFSNNVKIMVNFGEIDYHLEGDNTTVPPHGFVVFENGKEWKKGVCS